MRGSGSRGSIRGFRGAAHSSSGRTAPNNNGSSSSVNRASSSSSTSLGRPSIQPSSTASSAKANPALLALGHSSGGVGGTWGKARDPTGRISQFTSESDKCPICNTARYFNPNLKLMVSTCYHVACSSCIDRVFSQGPADCPTCGLTIRKTDFGLQTFEDLQVEKEVDVRRRVAKLFDKKQEDFEDLKEWNSYLEMVEEITYNLIHDLEPESTLKRIEAYKAKEKPPQTSFISTNPKETSLESMTSPSSAAYLSEDLENNQRKARAIRDMSRNERDSQLKKMEEKEIMRFLESDQQVGEKKNQEQDGVEKIKRKFQNQREKNRIEDEKEDEMLNRMEQERLREKALKNSNRKTKRRLNGDSAEMERMGVDGKINGREWSYEMLLDFRGPLSTLDDCEYLWKKDLKDPSPCLYGSDGNRSKRIEEELWLNEVCWDTKYSQRARAGGFDYLDWWARSARNGCETVGVGNRRDPVDQMDVDVEMED